MLQSSPPSVVIRIHALHMGIAVMIRSVPLAALPPNLRFPDDLRERVHYDTAKRQLQFDGFMSKRDFDKLLLLHNDIEYQRALEHLFQICVFTNRRAEQQAPHRRLVVIGAAVATMLLIGAGSLMLLLK
jgi:hypothetical protein